MTSKLLLSEFMVSDLKTSLDFSYSFCHVHYTVVFTVPINNCDYVTLVVNLIDA